MKYSQEKCKKCIEPYRSKSDRTGCYDPYEEVTMMSNLKVVATTLLIALIGFIFDLVTFVTFISVDRKFSKNNPFAKLPLLLLMATLILKDKVQSGWTCQKITSNASFLS